MEIARTSALVTGGASGLGAATARLLAARGARVAILDRDADKARALAAEIGGLGLGGDVASAEDMAAAFAAAAAAHGPPRIVVACAGIAPAARIAGSKGPHDLALFAQVIGVNLIGTFNAMRLAADAMRSLEPGADGERGVIVMTASVAAFEGQIGQAAYAASKAGVVGMTLPAARELAAHGIRVVSIAPGLFLTPLLLGLAQETQEALGKSVPFPARLGRPEEFGALVAHICENRMLNGEVIRLDGALRMNPK
jgi:NAD(P)-dependent dehydrogenase (short-subunit alcohol dehydrogenase family)